MIINRYFRREVLYTMIAVTTIVVFIFICNQFVRYLSYVASGKYAANVLVHLVSLQIPLLVSLLLPLGLFLGILLAYGRLYADSEMTVLMACGMSRKQLIVITMKFTVWVCLIVMIMNLFVNPFVSKQRDHLMDVAESSSIFQTVMPGRFQASNNDKQVFYVKKMNVDRSKMHDVFMAQALQTKPGEPQTWMVVAAKGGYLDIDHSTGDHYMVATEGYRYQGIPGKNNFKIIQYKTYHVRTGAPVFSGKNEGEEVLSTRELLKSAWGNPKNIAELQWRISVPLSVLILGLLAIPLSRVKSRQGRYAHFIPAVLIYVVYANLLFVSRNWIENGVVPGWIGMWWIHLIMLGVALFMLKKLSDNDGEVLPAFLFFWKR